MFDLMTPDVEIEPLPGRLERHMLTAGAWVDVLRGWVHHSDAVFETLLTQVDWRAERRQMYHGVVDVPRLLRWYGGGGNAPPPPPRHPPAPPWPTPRPCCPGTTPTSWVRSS